MRWLAIAAMLAFASPVLAQHGEEHGDTHEHGAVEDHGADAHDGDAHGGDVHEAHAEEHGAHERVRDAAARPVPRARGVPRVVALPRGRVRARAPPRGEAHAADRVAEEDEARHEERAADERYCSARVLECLELVNLSAETARKYPADLSGGMRKRVGIARAIAGQPEYLLYDEPTSGLDPVNADIIDDLVVKLRDTLGATSVVVSHDVRGAFRVADRVALLKDGKIRAFGTPHEFRESADEVVQEFIERDFGGMPQA